MEATDIDLCDPGNFVESVPHEWFAYLRRELPVQWHPDPEGFADGFWSVTRFDDCVNVTTSMRRSSANSA
jgi:cholest-4-en-3-one 26-monooxygenase